MIDERKNIILEKTFDFSLKVIKVYKFLIEEKREFILSKQLLRSATSTCPVKYLFPKYLHFYI